MNVEQYKNKGHASRRILKDTKDKHNVEKKDLKSQIRHNKQETESLNEVIDELLEKNIPVQEKLIVKQGKEQQQPPKAQKKQAQKNQPQPSQQQSQSALQHSKPVPQHSKPAPQHSKPAPQHSKPAPQQSQLAPQQSQLAPQQSQLAPQQSQLAPQQSQLAPQQSQLAPQQSQLAPQQSQLAPQHSKPAPQQSQLAPQQSQPAPQHSKPAPQQNKPVPQQNKSVPQQNKSVPQQNKPAPQQNKPAPQQSQPASQQSQPVKNKPSGSSSQKIEPNHKQEETLIQKDRKKQEVKQFENFIESSVNKSSANNSQTSRQDIQTQQLSEKAFFKNSSNNEGDPNNLDNEIENKTAINTNQLVDNVKKKFSKKIDGLEENQFVVEKNSVISKLGGFVGSFFNRFKRSKLDSDDVDLEHYTEELSLEQFNEQKDKILENSSNNLIFDEIDGFQKVVNVIIDSANSFKNASILFIDFESLENDYWVDRIVNKKGLNISYIPISKLAELDFSKYYFDIVVISNYNGNVPELESILSKLWSYLGVVIPVILLAYRPSSISFFEKARADIESKENTDISPNDIIVPAITHFAIGEKFDESFLQHLVFYAFWNRMLNNLNKLLYPHDHSCNDFFYSNRKEIQQVLLIGENKEINSRVEFFFDNEVTISAETDPMRAVFSIYECNYSAIFIDLLSLGDNFENTLVNVVQLRETAFMPIFLVNPSNVSVFSKENIAIKNLYELKLQDSINAWAYPIHYAMQRQGVVNRVKGYYQKVIANNHCYDELEFYSRKDVKDIIERSIELSKKTKNNAVVFSLYLSGFDFSVSSFNNRPEEITNDNWSKISNIFAKNTRDKDRIMLVSSNEFIIIMDNLSRLNAMKVAERLSSIIRESLETLEDPIWYLTPAVYIGYTEISLFSDSSKKVMSRIDSALSKACKSKRENIVMAVA